MYFRIQAMVDVKIGEYKVIKWKDMLLMVYWTHDGEKQCRIIGHGEINRIGELYTQLLVNKVIVNYVELSEKELLYWRQFVKLCDM